MNEDLGYRVLPDEPKFVPVALTEKERKAVQGLGGVGGCALWGTLVVVSHLSLATAVKVLALPDEYLLAALITSIAIASGTLALLNSWLRKKNLSSSEGLRAYDSQEKHNKGILLATREAESLTLRLRLNYKSSIESVAELHQHLNQATHFLQNAEIEYHSNAFAPFWDAVENAARHLSDFNGKTNQLSRNASEYYGHLNGKKHTFPAFPVQTRTIPDASSVLKEFRRVVRLGQTNFEFANIWEHRRTREVLIAGFRTLGEAVNNLSATLENSIYGLQESVSSEIAEVAEEEIKTRELLDKRMMEQVGMVEKS